MHKVVIVYDTRRKGLGTEKTVKILEEELKTDLRVETLRAGELREEHVRESEVFVFVAPVYVGKPHENVVDILKRFKGFLADKRVALLILCILKPLGRLFYLKHLRGALGRRGDVEGVIGGIIGPINLLKRSDVSKLAFEICKLVRG